ncbi:hypothetical protein BJF78_00460 [Pseudonocardia sp. CNS-139]|nr:hypothetical protein BJF78_00460 [Pseudonocardia sp. CNS-139]
MAAGPGHQAGRSADREAIKDALKVVADQGFTGALGPLTFRDNIARARGVLVQWDGRDETLASAA